MPQETHSQGKRKKVGIVLFQLGGPDSLETVEPFLYNLFCDPDIIQLMFGNLLRRPLAWYIARKRWKHAAHGYEAIGKRSPILPLTQRQAAALQRALQPHMEPRVVIAMRYWHPLTEAAVREIQGEPLDEIVLLPLYPQYSVSTTGSSFNEWDRHYRPGGVPVRRVREYYNHPLLIAAFVERIATSLRHFRRAPHSYSSDVHLVFSAHGLPLSLIEQGDPYEKQVKETVRLVIERGRGDFAARNAGKDWPTEHTLCYQSKVGKQEWLGPSLNDTLRRLGAEGKKRVLVVPIAFVSEHVETLHEINQEGREIALAAGIQHFEMVPALGDLPPFVAALASCVLSALGLNREAEAFTKSFSVAS